jgi:hypothetical protein
MPANIVRDWRISLLIKQASFQVAYFLGSHLLRFLSVSVVTIVSDCYKSRDVSIRPVPLAKTP